MPYERRGQPILSRRDFARRLLASAAIGAALVVVSLGIGTVGYHAFAGLTWIDSILNATMILTGMGPVDRMPTDGAKVFASAYALFSGVVFLSAITIVILPLLHRVLHRFHADSDD